MPTVRTVNNKPGQMSAMVQIIIAIDFDIR